MLFSKNQATHTNYLIAYFYYRFLSGTMATAYDEGLHQKLAGLIKADKPSLQALCMLLGDDLSGAGEPDEDGINPTFDSGKAELVTAIEKFIKNLNQAYVDISIERNKSETELDLTKAKLEDV